MTEYPGAISKQRARLTQRVYDSVLSKLYDRIQNHMIKLKEPAVEKLNLSLNDRVISFCCGTGQEFPFIEKKIGNQGFIFGIDYSSGMLKKASERIASNNWRNVDLARKDVTDLDDLIQEGDFDSGICTLGLSIIPDPKKAFDNLKRSVKTGGSIVISDMQALSGRKAVLNPLLTLLNAPFGNTYESLHKSRQFAISLQRELKDYNKEEYLFGSYYIVSGKK